MAWADLKKDCFGEGRATNLEARFQECGSGEIQFAWVFDHEVLAERCSIDDVWGMKACKEKIAKVVGY